MHRNLASRFALVATLAVAAAPIASLHAQTLPPTPPVVTFAQANGATVQGGGLAIVTVTVSDAVGLRTATLSGANRAASLFFSPGSKSGTMKLYWDTTYCKAGDYTFRSSASNTSSLRTEGSVTLHLVK